MATFIKRSCKIVIFLLPVSQAGCGKVEEMQLIDFDLDFLLTDRVFPAIPQSTRGIISKNRTIWSLKILDL